MSCLEMAQNLVFSTAWENFPYESGIGGSGNSATTKGRKRSSFDGGIPHNCVKLNVRNRLQELYPDKSPNMDTVGYAIFRLFDELEIRDFYSREDHGLEASDYWATLEAVYIPKEEYENKILSRIHEAVSESITPRGTKRAREVEALIKKPRIEFEDPAWYKEFECPITNMRMEDPVIGSDDITYEREAIEMWLNKHPRSPMTSKRMTVEELRPNLVLKNIIEAVGA